MHLFRHFVFSASMFSLSIVYCDAGIPAISRFEGSQQMNTPSKVQAVALSPDLVPFFADQVASLIAAKVVGRQEGREGKNELETGTLKLVVERVIHSPTLKRGDAIETPFARIADPDIRDRNQFDQWNSLTLEQGELLLLFVKPSPPPPLYIALAAEPLASLDDPELGAAERCYQIELHNGDPSAKRQLLTNALEGTADLSRFYAVDFLTHRHAFDRKTASAIFEAAISSANIPAEARSELGFKLASADLFDQKLGAEPVNVSIVSALAKQFVSAPNTASAQEWLGFLSSCVSREFSSDAQRDREMRSALVKAVRDPSPQQVISALTTAVRSASDPDEAAVAKRLLSVWQRAGG